MYQWEMAVIGVITGFILVLIVLVEIKEAEFVEACERVGGVPIEIIDAGAGCLPADLVEVGTE